MVDGELPGRAIYKVNTWAFLQGTFPSLKWRIFCLSHHSTETATQGAMPKSSFEGLKAPWKSFPPPHQKYLPPTLTAFPHPAPG